jgi:hypothetical protein
MMTNYKKCFHFYFERTNLKKVFMNQLKIEMKNSIETEHSLKETTHYKNLNTESPLNTLETTVFLCLCHLEIFS